MLVPLLLSLFMPSNDIDPSLLTVAEQSGYTATASSAEVMALIERMHQRSAVMQVAELGRTVEGQHIPMIVLSNPPFTLDAERPATSVAQDSRPICFIMANIHAGEVEGKEACLMLARDIALHPGHPLLKDLVIIIAPNYNADGNDQFGDVAKHRPGQIGPAQCGVRHNSAGLDLNRDYMKLEAPESRGLVKFLNTIDPDITIDCHTTNGSHHRYTLTYDAPLNPSGHSAPIDFVRHQLLPEVTRRVQERTGYDMWFYGNFNRDHTTWATYSAEPRFGGPYQGLRNQMSILSEAYSYAPFKDRIICTREFLREILRYVAENKQQVLEINQRARRETQARGVNPQPSDLVGIRHRIAAMPRPAIVKGYEHARGGEGGAAADPHLELGAPKDYAVVHLGRFEPILSVVRPCAYIIPPGLHAIVEKLQQHGVIVEPIDTARNAVAQVYKVNAIQRAERAFQGHHEVTVDVEARVQPLVIASGSHLVSTAQPLGTLAVYLLEPQSEDGLATWNFLDDHLHVGQDFPIVRIRSERDWQE